MSRAAPSRPDGGCALVTGASRGIGAATAIRLARSGLPVGVNYNHDHEGADRVVAEIREQGGRAIALQGDVSDPACPDAIFAALEEEFGPVLVLVNNAGATADELLITLDHERWSALIDLNLTASYAMSRRAFRGMSRRRWGRIINVSSIAGARAARGQAAYAASKAGLEGLTRVLAIEAGGRGITANSVAPGYVRTAMTAAFADREAELAKVIPVGRPGEPDDIAATIAYLASDHASYVNGVTLLVDGGLAAAGVSLAGLPAMPSPTPTTRSTA